MVRSSMKTDPKIVTLDDNLGLNLYVMPTTYHVVIISVNQRSARRRCLDGFSQKSIENSLLNLS